MTKTLLGTYLMVAVLSAELPAFALGQSIAAAQPPVLYRQGEICDQQVIRGAVVVRCVVADHGMAAGERYDAQGNPVDRLGNIVATPASDGRAIRAREVFTAEPSSLR